MPKEVFSLLITVVLLPQSAGQLPDAMSVTPTVKLYPHFGASIETLRCSWPHQENFNFDLGEPNVETLRVSVSFIYRSTIWGAGHPQTAV